MISIFKKLFKASRKSSAGVPVLNSIQPNTETLDLLADACYTVDKDWNMTYANSLYLKMMAVRQEVRIGKDFRKVLIADGLRDSEYWTSLHQVMSSRLAVEFESQLPSSDSKIQQGEQKLFYRILVRPLSDGGLAVRFQDITKQKQVETDLKLKSEAIENSLNGFDIVDENGRIIVVNKAYLRMWGYDSEDEVLGTLAADHCADPEMPKFIIGELKKHGQCDVEFLAKRKDNSTFFVRMLAYKAHNSLGEEIYPTTSIDISLQKQSQLAVENERQNLRNLFKQTPEMVCYLKGPDHVFEFTNEAHVRVLGFDATGLAVRQAQAESVEVHGILDQVYRSGITAELIEIPITVTDRLRYFNLTFAARFDEFGSINGVMILGVEITDQVLSRISLERVANLIDQMPAPFFALNSDWQITYWNNGAEEAIGRKNEEVLGKVLWDAFPAALNSNFEKYYRQVMTERSSASFEAFYPGIDKWYRAWPFPFEEGIAVTFLDITDQKMAEIQLGKSQLRYQHLFDHSPTPKWTLDIPTLRFLEVNQAAIRHYGYTKEEFLAMTPKDIHIASENQLGSHSLHTLRHRKKDGALIDVEINALDTELDGRQVRIVAITDITEKLLAEARQKEIVEKLQDAKTEAERANQLKSAFLANMSHEIRTPLGAMMGFADLLKDPDLSLTERSSFVDVLIRNGEQLSLIINDILDLSKVEAGHLNLDYTEIQSDQAITDACSLFKMKAKEKNLTLEIKIEESTPKTIVTDSLRFRQILLNIMGNAVKFTNFGGIRVRTFGCKTENNTRNALCIEIKDTGIGISSEFVDQLFEVFVQGDNSMTRKFGGTGLGLALSRRLGRALGGDVTIEETSLGKGTTFKIVVEDLQGRETQSHSEEKELPPIDLSETTLDGVSVLVVDDSPDNQQLIWRILTGKGAQVETADNGLLGYRKAIAGSYDLVIMDIQMPEMDGFTATQELRAAGFQKPIIALTAHAMNEVRNECFNVGCTDHLPKPIKSKQLIGAVAKYAGRTHQILTPSS